VETFFDQGEYGQREFAQGFGCVQARLRLLIVEKRLEYGECLFVRCGAEGLRGGRPHGRIRMPCQIGRHKHGALIAQSQQSLDGAGPDLHRGIACQSLKQWP
jgi:hypothetical protein